MIQGLKNVHKAGYYHGDLKLDNILIVDNSIIKLSDFGLSGIEIDMNSCSGLMGTPGYMAPE